MVFLLTLIYRVSSCQPGPVKTAFMANMGSANNQPEFLKLTEEKNIDKESREVCGKIFKLLINSPTFEEEQQTPEEIASVIKGGGKVRGSGKGRRGGGSLGFLRLGAYANIL